MGIGFQPTYEELKHNGYADKAPIPVLGFQPTYEELKLSIGIHETTPHACFQPTYEELKLWNLQ